MRNAAIKNLIVSNFIDPTFVTDRFMPNMELQTDLRRSVFITFPTGRQVRAIRPINSKLSAPGVFLPGFTDMIFTSAIVEQLFVCILLIASITMTYGRMFNILQQKLCHLGIFL
jgi:hypothetical protein